MSGALLAGNNNVKDICCVQLASTWEEAITICRGGPLWSPVGGGCGPFIDEPTSSGSRWATIKAHHPSAHRLRPLQNLQLSVSEGSHVIDYEMLRFAQHDKWMQHDKYVKLYKVLRNTNPVWLIRTKPNHSYSWCARRLSSWVLSIMRR